MAQPAQIALEKGAQIGNAVFQHGDALDSHAEGKTLVSIWVDAAHLEHLGMHHAAAENLEPVLAGADPQLAAGTRAADVELGRRLGEGEEAGAKAHRQITDGEISAAEIDETAFEM